MRSQYEIGKGRFHNNTFLLYVDTKVENMWRESFFSESTRFLAQTTQKNSRKRTWAGHATLCVAQVRRNANAGFLDGTSWLYTEIDANYCITTLLIHGNWTD